MEKTFLKKHFPAYSCKAYSEDKIFKKVRGSFLKINESSDIKPLVISHFRKIVLHIKVINKIRTTKNQENFAFCFGENYPTNRLLKLLQDKTKP